jgi:hypothetical protein
MGKSRYLAADWAWQEKYASLQRNTENVFRLFNKKVILLYPA